MHSRPGSSTSSRAACAAALALCLVGCGTADPGANPDGGFSADADPAHPRGGDIAPPTAIIAPPVATPDPAGNRKLDKTRATGRIDGMVALAMAEGVEAMHSDALVPLDDWIASYAA